MAKDESFRERVARVPGVNATVGAYNLVLGLATYIPGLDRLTRRRKACGSFGVYNALVGTVLRSARARQWIIGKPGAGTGSAGYAYEVWLKHLTMAHHSGMAAVPRTVVEIGPGDSMGVGLAALLSGASCYIGVEYGAHRDTERNLALLAELAVLLGQRAPRPPTGWPNYDPYLDEALFPSGILDDSQLAASLAPARIARLEQAARVGASADGEIRAEYVDPALGAEPIAEGSVDLIVSHAAMEHVAAPEAAYRAFYRWLRPGGLMSHQIDFGCHDVALPWNGHWMYGARRWQLIVGRRPYLINRAPRSAHLEMIERCGFEVVSDLALRDDAGIARRQLARDWLHLSDEDLRTRGAFVQARRPLAR